MNKCASSLRRRNEIFRCLKIHRALTHGIVLIFPLSPFAEPGEAGSREKRRACVVNDGGGKLLTRCVGMCAVEWMVNCRCRSGPGKLKGKNHYEPRELVNEVNTHEWHCSCSFSCVQWITRIGLVETRNTQPTTRRWLWTPVENNRSAVCWYFQLFTVFCLLGGISVFVFVAFHVLQCLE